MHAFLQAKRKLRAKAKTSITCFMTTTTTTTQAHSHKKENRTAAIKKTFQERLDTLKIIIGYNP